MAYTDEELAAISQISYSQTEEALRDKKRTREFPVPYPNYMKKLKRITVTQRLWNSM